MIRLPALLAALAASPAGALTCAPPDLMESVQAAREAPEAFAVLLGRLDFDAGLMPDGGHQGGATAPAPVPAPVPDPVPARFQGGSLTPEGFAPSSIGAVTLRPTCAGPWCGSIGPGEWLLLARQGPGGWDVEVGPCGGAAFEPPAPPLLDGLTACLAGRGCSPSP